MPVNEQVSSEVEELKERVGFIEETFMKLARDMYLVVDGLCATLEQKENQADRDMWERARVRDENKED